MKPSPALLISLLALAGCGRASLPGDGTPAANPRPDGPIEQHLFPPDLVMDHQAALGLTPEQQQTLRGEIERGQAELLRLQWDMTAAREQLGRLLETERPDEAQVTAGAGKVLALEDQIKLRHLTMLVRVKSALNAEQQRQLRAWRRF